MVKKRLIACLLCRDGIIVQSKGFSHTNAVGNAITAVDFFNMWAIDEIIILDVSRNKNQRQKFYDIINELSQRCFVPLTVGGWITSVEDAKTLLQKGADKITINTEAVKRPELIKELSEVFGSQFVVVSIDVKINDQGKHEVYIDRGKCPTGLSSFGWAKKVEHFGAGEIFLTSIDKDGTLKGYDIELVKGVSELVEIPVIASGGVGNWQHLVDGVQDGGADAVSAANIFHYTEQSTKNAKEYMKDNGIDVRKIYFYTIDTPRRPKYEV